jgi:triosephosphate isomerase
MTRTRLVAGNWKMNGSRSANRSLLEAVRSGLAGLADVDCAVCVPFPYLAEVADQLRGSP